MWIERNMTQANFDMDTAIQALRDGTDLMGKGGD